MWCQYVEKVDGMPKEAESFVDKILDHVCNCDTCDTAVISVPFALHLTVCTIKNKLYDELILFSVRRLNSNTNWKLRVHL